MRMRQFPLGTVWAIAAIGLMSIASFGATVQNSVSAELRAESETITPGQTFKVGVLFHIEPGWHIYWKNPGEAGLATEVEWTLPEGFVAGKLQWPVPKRFDQGGGIIGYGYEDEAMLIADVTPSAGLKPGDLATVRAKVTWLGCHEICLPGSAELVKEIAVATTAGSPDEALFQKWMGRMPRPAKDLIEAESAMVQTAPNVAGPQFHVSMEITWWRKPAEIEFFPAPDEGLLMSQLVITEPEGKTNIAFDVSRVEGTAGNMVEGVIAYSAEEGPRKGLQVQAILPETSGLALTEHEEK